MSTVTDSWSPSASTSSSSSSRALPSPPSTPSKRASRSSGTSNDTDHAHFTRTSTDSSSGLSHSVQFSIGDVVVVGADAKLKQKFLAPSPYLVQTKVKKGKGKKAHQQQQAEYKGWKHEDGLQGGDKVAVITRLYEDVRGRKMALVRWFARPGAVWGPEEPDEDEEVGDVMPYELYYTADSTHLHESRAIRSRAASNPFSSPSKSSSPSKRSSFTPSHLSAAASFRTPQHSDPIPISTITSRAEVLSPSTLAATGETQITATMQKAMPTFLCRRVYDVKPVAGAGFWSEVEWEELREGAVEVYEECRKEGKAGREEAKEGWDVEAAMEEEESEDEAEVRRRRKVEKMKKAGRKEKAVKREVARMRDEEESSDDDGEDEEDTFDPRSNASDASSDSGSEGDRADSDSSAEDDDEDLESDNDFPRTPTKRGRRTSHLPTPSSSSRRGRPSASTTSPSKRPAAPKATGRAAKRRKFASSKSSLTASSSSSHNPLPPLLSSTHLASLTPFERAKALLHVSATPEALPCREEQRERIYNFLGDAILGRTGGCLYVHGVPGTGKTATVHSVVRELQNDPDMDAFTFVEINGMKISEPMAAFSHLWTALAPSSPSSSSPSPRKPSPRAAVSLLEQHFSNPDPARKTTVVLVDELDQMLTKRQDVLYSFFNWPHVPHSRLVVVAVANTMDLPERELSGKIRSRLGTNRIPFQPYTWLELKRILEARLALVDPSSSSKAPPLFNDVALQKIAKSVAGISGDARKALDVARRTLDRVALRLASSGQTLEEEQGESVRCTIQDATQAYNDMTRQGPAVFVRRQSMMGKVLLLAVAQCVRRAGVQEVEVDTVLTWHLDFLRQTSLLPSSVSPPSKSELFAVLAQLHALRLVATESQRLDVFQRVRATVDEGDLFAALREDELLKGSIPKVA
ncbi:hypothetical protein JCM8547_004414 [Rhodosporidiobolus lusitaniae]